MSGSDDVFINEIHYDNVGTDAGEAVEIAGPAGTNLTGWTLVFYNGSVPGAAVAYRTTALSGVIDDEGNGYGALSFTLPVDGIQNGNNDGVALVRPDGTVVQLLSYEGVLVASGGAASGLTSTDIGVAETTTTPVGFSLQLRGSGTNYSNFTWATESTASFGSLNTGQTLGKPPAVANGALTIVDASIVEGNSGTQDLVFAVNRANGSDGAVSATWTVTFPANAAATDLGVGQLLTGVVSFAAGVTTGEVRVSIAGDTTFEPNETFTVTLSNPTGGVTIADGSATGTIQNDDAAPVVPLANVFFNEFHYDNSNTDAGEAIEIAGVAGTDLTGWTIVLYNGNGGVAYAATGGTASGIPLSGTIPDLQNGYGTVSVLAPGIQNGAPDGFALVDALGRVVQFLSYEGSFTATAGPATGLTSIDVGVSEEVTPAAGFSLRLTGAGSSYADFSWQEAAPDSFGAINAGQSFLSSTGPAQIRISDARVAEGNSGTTNLLFTVNRAGGIAGAHSVDYNVVLDGTANSADFAAGAVFTGTVSFAAGEYAKQISVAIAGDTVGERNETFTVNLGNLTGTGTITDNSAQGLIVNDDVLPLRTYEIQGERHVSEFVGQTVDTSGIVTAVDTNGFYLQDATGDGNARTSDALFVLTGTAPTVVVGHAATVRGVVSEFTGGAGQLSTTQVAGTTISVTSSGNALPAAVLIGSGGVLPPSEWIDDDGLTVFDPQNDGIDFWESLEGMRVAIDRPIAVSNTDSGATDVVASRGVGASGINDRGGITISPNGNPGSNGDFNPETIKLYADSGVNPAYNPNYSVGDGIATTTGVVSYFGGSYEVIVTAGGGIENDVTLTRETTTLQGSVNHLSIATYNLENVDSSDMKFDILASDIVYRLRAPDILGVQEIQDADGAGTGSNLSGTITAQGIIDSIFTQSGLRYAYVEIAPTTPNTTGGEPNGNIRNGFFYNIDRVSYVTGSAELITGSAYSGSRNPLAATFEFNGQAITAINVHFTSRGGSSALEGAIQPPNDAGEGARTAQAAGVKAYVNDHLADDPGLNFAILGDWNGFYFEGAQTQLTDPMQGGAFVNLAVALLPEAERYSYLFDGNAQLLDNIMVTRGLATGAQYDAVHLNSQLSGSRPTDHDPQVALLNFNRAPTALIISNASIAENLPAGSVVGQLSATDTAGDTPSYTLTDNAGGLFAVNGSTGVVTTTAAFNYEALATYSITALVTDTGGATTSTRFDIAVTNINEAPAGTNASLSLVEGSSRVLTAADFGFSDVDGNAFAAIRVSALPGAGQLTFDADGSGPGVPVSASVGQIVTIADINAGKLAYVTPSGVNNGATNFSFQVQDNGGTASGGVDLDASPNTISYTITAVTPPGPPPPVTTGTTTYVEADYSQPSGSTATVITPRNQGDNVALNLTGNAGTQTIIGNYGPNVLTDGGGADTLVGLLNNDTYVVSTFETVVVENNGEGTDTVLTSANYILPTGTSIEVLSALNPTGTAPIFLTGNALDQRITGNAGDNIINGLGGSDTMAGLGGNDTYLVRGPGDIVLETNGEGSDTAYTTVSYNLGVNEVEVLSAVTHSDATQINLTGNYLSQTIIGNYGDNLLNGGSGMDTLVGLFGNDLYAVGDSRIVIVEAEGQGVDTVVTSVNYALGADASVEVLSAQIRSSTVGLSLTGNGFGQTIAGTEGADTINGGAGSDVLIGGGGADRFDFTTLLGSTNVDAITDFGTGDRIGLSSAIFGAVGATLDAGEFVIGSAAADADDRIVYNQTTGQIFYDADGNGAGLATLFAVVTPGTILSSASFEVIAP